MDDFIFLVLKLIISFSCSVNDLQNFFMQSLHLYTSNLRSTLLDNNIVYTEKCDAIFSSVFIVDKLSG